MDKIRKRGDLVLTKGDSLMFYYNVPFYFYFIAYNLYLKFDLFCFIIVLIIKVSVSISQNHHFPKYFDNDFLLKSY